MLVQKVDVLLLRAHDTSSLPACCLSTFKSETTGRTVSYSSWYSKTRPSSTSTVIGEVKHRYLVLLVLTRLHDTVIQASTTLRILEYDTYCTSTRVLAIRSLFLQYL